MFTFFITSGNYLIIHICNVHREKNIKFEIFLENNLEKEEKAEDADDEDADTK